jgi:hypothetical protein
MASNKLKKSAEDLYDQGKALVARDPSIDPSLISKNENIDQYKDATGDQAREEKEAPSLGSALGTGRYGDRPGESRIDTTEMIRPLGSALLQDKKENVMPVTLNPSQLRERMRAATLGSALSFHDDNSDLDPTKINVINENPEHPEGVIGTGKVVDLPADDLSAIPLRSTQSPLGTAYAPVDPRQSAKHKVIDGLMESAGLPSLSEISPTGTALPKPLGTAMPTYSGPTKRAVMPGTLIPSYDLPNDEKVYAQHEGDDQKQDQDAAHASLLRQRATLKQQLLDPDLVVAGNARRQLAELEKQTPYGSFSNHPGILGKIEHGLAKAGNIAGDILAPGTTALIPGTDLHRAEQVQQGEGEAKLGSALRSQDAETRQKNALTDAMGQPKPTEEKWNVVQGFQGPNGEPVQQEEHSGQLRVAPVSGVTAKAKGADAPANEEQVAEYQSQIPALTPFLSAGERVAYAFPTGYKPTLAEISSMKKDAAAANAAALSGNREKRAAAAAAAASNKKSLEENVIDGAAKSIASMDVHDLSPLKDIASLRGDQRLLIYQKAKQINPNFNTAEVQRKVKMLDQFTDGKDGQNLQSFGTFFEHAGNLSQAINDLRNFKGGAELLNKPWNWFENHTGDPRVVQFMAAAEPVKKEFESFLLNNRALYESDRKSMDEVLNGDMSPAKLQAALKVMGHTATARYTEMNNRFKNTVGTSIDGAIGPMSDESLKSAAKIGVTKIGNNVLRNGQHGYGWYQEGQ